MRLKSIEIKGFKSFADQTVIHFNEDVIGIVGPNGSGKSNIVDAIRWVLGEQSSRELRLDQMLSVIFNGARKRKAAGLAQVSLTFENTRNLLPTDFNSVTISRLLYRTGESEYRLNGVPCRLRDITSLFLDTGIGSNSYAIIALGMVDDILEDKEDARRRMFEQAAGVAKYKLRKRETLSKLKSATEDLERIQDLLHEIGNNLKTLEKQAKRARRYFELRAQYKKSSIDLALLKVASLKDSHKTLQQQIEQEQDRYRQLDVQSRQLESQIQQEQKKHLDKEKDLSDKQRELNALTGQIRGMENDRNILRQKQQFIEQALVRIGEERKNAGVRLQQLQEEIEYYRGECNLEKRVEARLEQELVDAEAALAKVRETHGAVKSSLDTVAQEQQFAEKALFELEKQKAVDSNQIANLQKELDQREDELEQRRSAVTHIKTQMDAWAEKEAEVLKVIEGLEAEEQQRLESLRLSEAEYESLEKQLSRTRRELDAQQNEFKLTRSMVENLEGFPESIRFLSNQKEWKKRAFLFSDLIYVDKEYRVAIENFLEPYLNFYVVESLEDAYQAVQLLSRSQQGKANFFVLEAFRDYRPPMTLLPGALRAVDLVQTDAAYVNLCSFLLQNVLISESEDAGKGLPDGDYTIISRSGAMVKSRYALSGGSVGLFEGKKIGRKKNLEVLEKAIQRLVKAEQNDSSQAAQVMERIKVLKNQAKAPLIQQERERLNKFVKEKVALETSYKNFENLIAEVAEKRKALQAAIGMLQSGVSNIEEGLLSRLEALEAAKAKISQTDERYREIAETLSQASSAFNEKNIQFIRHQNKVAALQRELAFREKQYSEAQATLENGQKNIESNNQELGRIFDEIETLEKNLQLGYADRKAKEGALSAAEQTYFQARSGIAEMEDQLRKNNRQAQELQTAINVLKDKFNDVKFEISSIAQRLRIEFEVGINDILQQEPETDLPAEQLQAEVDGIRKKLDQYGEINPMAVEAYDEMKIRFDSISGQRDDILQAKVSLEKTMQEIEETATAQFLSAFDQVRIYFIDVFRSLFTDSDNCDLILLNPENPLESKIEIVAKPKGKRPQTISQLSGGEKTLTAIALLFALYLLKPAPFCIFDEVDAPLDDANISKFNRIIQKFSKDSQFIIVTHNKLTMAAVHTIYGVYMAEQGVSGVTPVNFRDYEFTPVFGVGNPE
jgi:chromosome segregation protein